jgi:hypothetical protein
MFRGFLGSDRIASVMKIFDGFGLIDSFDRGRKTFCLIHSAGKEIRPELNTGGGRKFPCSGSPTVR